VIPPSVTKTFVLVELFAPGPEAQKRRTGWDNLTRRSAFLSDRDASTPSPLMEWWILAGSVSRAYPGTIADAIDRLVLQSAGNTSP
jgi:hypothetical protein